MRKKCFISNSKCRAIVQHMHMSNSQVVVLEETLPYFCIVVLQRSMGMSYLSSDRLQMRTVQTEAPAVHRMRGEKKKSMNECLNLSTPIRENSCAWDESVLVKI